MASKSDELLVVEIHCKKTDQGRPTRQRTEICHGYGSSCSDLVVGQDLVHQRDLDHSRAFALLARTVIQRLTKQRWRLNLSTYPPES